MLKIIGRLGGEFEEEIHFRTKIKIAWKCVITLADSLENGVVDTIEGETGVGEGIRGEAGLADEGEEEVFGANMVVEEEESFAVC